MGRPKLDMLNLIDSNVDLFMYLIEWISQLKVDPRSYERNYMQLRKEAWKKKSGLQRGLKPWPRDTGATL